MILIDTFKKKAGWFALAVLGPLIMSGEAQSSPLVTLGKINIKGDVEKGKDLSAIASLDGRHGIWASDETSSVQTWSWDPVANELTTGESVPLLGADSEEIDLEGLAADPQHTCYYATGSHGLSRHAKRTEANRRWFFQIPVSAAAGQPPRYDPTKIKKASLARFIEKIPELKNAWNQPVSEGGLDIEGLSYHDGFLYFGLRSPLIGNQAPVIKFAAATAFSDQQGTPTLLKINLGAGRGIRDLVRMDKGWLVLAGDDGASNQTAGTYTLHRWDGRSSSAPLYATLPASEGKAEGLWLISENDHTAELIIVYDGLKHGGATRYQLKK